MIKKKHQTSLAAQPVYRRWQALFMAFYSSRLYVDVATRWSGFGFSYFILMISITIIPLSVRVMIDFNHYVEEQLFLPFKQIPPLYIQNGDVLFDKPMPYLIKNKKGSVLVIVDSTAKASEMYQKYPELTLLVTKNKLYSRPPKFHLFLMTPRLSFGNTIQSYSFDKSDNEVFVGSEWIAFSHIKTFKWLLMFLFYPLMAMFFLGLLIIIMVVFVFLGQVFSHVVLKFDLKFDEASRLLLVASTPQFTALFILLSFNVVIAGIGIFYVGLLAAYFTHAVLVVKRARKKMVLY